MGFDAFLTTEASDVVRPIHAKAMPVLLTTADERETWLTGSATAFHLLRRTPRRKNEVLGFAECPCPVEMATS